MQQQDELIHLFSYETGVSFELPLGWEVRFEAPGVAEHGIDDDDDDDDENGEDGGAAADGAGAAGAVRFSVLAVGESDDPDAAGRLSDELLAAAGRSVLDRRRLRVDDAEVSLSVSRGAATAGEGDNGARAGAVEVVVVQAVAHRGRRLWVLRGTAPQSVAGQYRPVFEAAIASARFIELDGGRR